MGEAEAGEASAVEYITATFDTLLAGIDASKAMSEEAKKVSTLDRDRATEALTSAQARVEWTENDVRIHDLMIAKQKELHDQTQARAIETLHQANLPPSQTYLAQTHFEGGDEEQAQAAIDRIVTLNEYLDHEGAEHHLLVAHFLHLL